MQRTSTDAAVPAAQRLRRAADAHELLGALARGDDIGVTIARAIALATGLPSARGWFFGAVRGRINPVGTDDQGEVGNRSTPSTLDTQVWAVGDKYGYAPFGAVSGDWLTVQIRLGKEIVGGAIVETRYHLAEHDTVLQRSVQGVASHAAALLSLRAELANAQKVAATDPLTGVTSRAAFYAELERVSKSRDAFVIFLADLDGLKGVNDTEGHAAGDKMIQDAARALRRVIRPDETVGRIGGDEFTVLCRITIDEAPALHRRFTHALTEVGISASIGYAPIENDGEEALAIADARMYQEKKLRRAERQRDGRLRLIDGGRDVVPEVTSV